MASRGWISMRVTPGVARDAILAALFAGGAQGVQELGDDLITQLATDAEVAAVSRAVLEVSADARIVLAPLPDVDWSEQWKRGIRAQVLGDLVITPPWLADGFDPARAIVIEPAMAFGTGEHATTRGVVRLLAAAIRPGDRVADLGAGSAVLAIAAAKLGASHVAAIELDPDALSNAEENVRRNGVADRVIVIEGDAGLLLPLVAPVDLVTANIISSVLVELLPTIADALSAGGRAILSGILASERDDMLGTLDATGWRVDAEDHEDEWWSATIVRR
jgi:ribosomal protein L11 methyltransferase